MTEFKTVPYGEVAFSQISSERFPNEAFALMQRRPILGLVRFIEEFSGGTLLPHVETLRLIPEIYRKKYPLWRFCPAIYFFGGRDYVDDTVERLKSSEISHANYKRVFDFNGVGYHIENLSTTWDDYKMFYFGTFEIFRPRLILAKFGDFSKLKLEAQE